MMAADRKRPRLLAQDFSLKNLQVLIWLLVCLVPQIIHSFADIAELPSADSITPKDYWSNGIVPYEIDAGDHGFSPQQRFQIEDALKLMENSTCGIHFRLKTNEIDYVQFAKALSPSVCYAIGAGLRNISGAHRIYLGNDCLSPANAADSVMREVAHVLGLVGEHHRPDRDQYIEVVEKNVLPDTLSQFVKFASWLPTWEATEYDYISITHYPTNAFSISPTKLDTIRLRQKPLKNDLNIKTSDARLIGSQGQLSDLDKVKLNRIYPCASLADPAFSSNFNAQQNDFAIGNRRAGRFE